VPAAASRSCAALLTWPRAAATADTVLPPGLAVRSCAAVLSWSSAALSALVCVCHLPRASFTSFVRAALTLWMSEVISVAAPDCTLTWVSWFSEARRAAMSAHRTELDGEAAAGEEDDGAAEDVPPGEVLLEAHPASSARPHAVTTTSFHQAALALDLKLAAEATPEATLKFSGDDNHLFFELVDLVLEDT